MSFYKVVSELTDQAPEIVPRQHLWHRFEVVI